MTKEDFYKELVKLGVDIDDTEQMTIFAKALMKYGEDILRNKQIRCESCYFKSQGKECIGEICPQFNIPDDPTKAVEFEFERDAAFDFKSFVMCYVRKVLIEDGYISQNE